MEDLEEARVVRPDCEHRAQDRDPGGHRGGRGAGLKMVGAWLGSLGGAEGAGALVGWMG